MTVATKQPPVKGQQGHHHHKSKHHHKTKVVVPDLSVVRRPRADFDVEHLKLQGKDLSAKLAQAITDGSIATTIEGASTLSITVSDWYGSLLRSELLTGQVTLEFDQGAYTLVKISTGSNTMVLTFEDTAVNLLRQYDKAKKANRSKVTRAEFVLSMIQEVKEAKIPYLIPELHVVQPIAQTTAKVGDVAVKNAKAKKPGEKGGNTSGWITTIASWYSGSQGAYGTLSDGGWYYAELGVAGANEYMNGILGPALGKGPGKLPANTQLEVQFRGKQGIGKLRDVGSGAPGFRGRTVDLHSTFAHHLGFTSAGVGSIRCRLVNP